MKATWIICSLLALPAGAASAADSPWNGTWKLDAAKSQLTGQTFSYSQRPGGMLHYEDGSTASFDFGIDGKEYKTWADRTTAWTPAGMNAWDTITRSAGKVRAKGHIALSEDGKTLTATYSGTRADGQDFHEEDVFSRVSGAQGLIGTWRSTKVSNPGGGPQTFIISSPAKGVLRYDIPDLKVSLDCSADDKDYPLTGPTMPPGMTIGFKRVNATRIRYTIKINGKPDNMGIQAIAADGASFTDTNWNAGKESEKTMSVYVKQ